MAVRSGFWNSVGTDVRTYYNRDFSHLINLLINDGVHQNYGTQFAVIPGEGMQVIVQTGEAWFNSTWLVNETDLQVAISSAPIIAGYKRMDAIAIKIDETSSVRNGTIEYIEGTPGAGDPVAPALVDTDEIHWHLLATVMVQANDISIAGSRIENHVGTTGTPFITGILATVDITRLITQWQSEWTEWLTAKSTEYTTWINASESDFTTWSTAQKTAFVEWMTQSKGEFNDWFDNIKYILDGDVAGHLQNEIDDHERRIIVLEAEPKHIYMSESEYENFDPTQHPNTEVGVYEDPVDPEV